MTRAQRQGALVSAATAARRLGVDVRTVRSWISRKRLSGVDIEPGEGVKRRWYVHTAALERLIAERRRP